MGQIRFRAGISGARNLRAHKTRLSALSDQRPNPSRCATCPKIGNNGDRPPTPRHVAAPGQRGWWRPQMAGRHVARTRVWVTCALPRRLAPDAHAPPDTTVDRAYVSPPMNDCHVSSRPIHGTRVGFVDRAACAIHSENAMCPPPWPMRHPAPLCGPHCMSRPIIGRHVAPSRSTTSPVHPNPLKTFGCPFLGIRTQKNINNHFQAFFHAESNTASN